MNIVKSSAPDAGNDPTVNALDAQYAVEVHAASGAIVTTTGTVVITKLSALAAMTLALPKAGLPSVGGNDGNTLNILSTTAEAHTITTPTNGINGGHTVITFSAVADFAQLVAYNGTWWFTMGTPTNVTITT